MIRSAALALISALLFAVIVLVKNALQMEMFFMAAVSMALFSVLGQKGNYLKHGISLLVGVAVALIGIILLSTQAPLPPANLLPLVLVCSLSLFLFVLGSLVGLSTPGLVLGWASYLATIWSTYNYNVTALASEALPSAVGVSAALLLGLVMALVLEIVDVRFLNQGKEGSS